MRYAPADGAAREGTATSGRSERSRHVARRRRDGEAVRRVGRAHRRGTRYRSRARGASVRSTRSCWRWSKRRLPWRTRRMWRRTPRSRRSTPESCIGTPRFELRQDRRTTGRRAVSASGDPTLLLETILVADLRAGGSGNAAPSGATWPAGRSRPPAHPRIRSWSSGPAAPRTSPPSNRRSADGPSEPRPHHVRSRRISVNPGCGGSQRSIRRSRR